jgi:hypothetical protein
MASGESSQNQIVRLLEPRGLSLRLFHQMKQRPPLWLLGGYPETGRGSRASCNRLISW